MSPDVVEVGRKGTTFSVLSQNNGLIMGQAEYQGYSVKWSSHQWFLLI